MSLKNLVLRLAFAVLVWATGFVAGAVVFAVPMLRNLPEIAGISVNPAISTLAIATWIPLVWWYSRRQLAGSRNLMRNAVNIGFTLCLTSVALDYAVLVLAMETGFAFYRFVAIWVAYSLLLFLPSWVAWRLSIDAAGE